MVYPICTVLIVKDNSIDREHPCVLLADLSHAYSLLKAASISEGILLCRSNDVDIVLLDTRFSEKNEVSFLAALNIENNGSSPPVVVIIDEGDEGVVLEAMKQSAADHVLKRDLTPILLQEKIRYAMEKATLRRQIQQMETDRIREAERDRDRFFDLSIDLMSITNTSGYFVRLNPAWEKTLGFTIEELMAEPYLHWVHPDDRSATISAGQALTHGKPVIQFENRYRCKDGSYRWFSWNTQPYIPQGLVYGVVHDITEQKQAELLLRKKEETIYTQLAEIESIYSTAPIGFCSTDAQFRYIRINKHLAQINGLSVEDHIGRTFQEVIPSVADQLEQLCSQVMKSRIPIIDLEMRGTVPHQPDIMHDWLVSYYPKILPDGRLVGVNFTVQEITDRKNAQSILEERNQELKRFAHVVSHDLKAPLRAVSNLSQWIEDDLEGTLTTDTQYQMTLLRRRVDRMALTIDGLLDYACIGSSNAALEAFSVAELIAEAIDSLALPPTFNMVISPDLPNLKTDRLRLLQVFANLIGNAICHHDRSDGRVHISCKDSGHFYEFAVADDGPGIEPKHHEKIFAIFQSINPQNSPNSTGIGLSIVKKIVETEGGTVRLESQLGQGATFYFTWPR